MAVLLEKDRGEGQKAVLGVVVDLLPNAAFLVELDTRALVTAHTVGAKANFSRLRRKDRVLVELSPHDPTRGRITKLLEQGRAT